MTKLFDLEEELKKEKNNLDSKKLTTGINGNQFLNQNVCGNTIRLAKSLEDVKDEIKVMADAHRGNSSSDENSGDELIEILSATLKKKIELETKPFKVENDDEDMSNVRQTMLSFLEESINIFSFL